MRFVPALGAAKYLKASGNNLGVFSALPSRLLRILDHQDKRVTATKLHGGLAGNVWQLSFQSSGLNVILKDSLSKQFLPIDDLLVHLVNLKNHSANIIGVLGKINVEQRTFVLYEYALPIREITQTELNGVFGEMLKVSETYHKTVNPPKIFTTETAIKLFHEVGLDIFNSQSVQAAFSEQDVALAQFEKKFAAYFMRPNDFSTKFKDLPVRFIHGDFKKDNVIMTKDGPKIIDWDEAFFDRRLRELVSYIGGALETENLATVFNLIADLPGLLSNVGVELTKLEQELFLLYLVLRIVETNVWVLSEIKKKPGEVRPKLINILNNNRAFLRTFLSMDTSQLGWPPLCLPDEITFVPSLS